MLSLANSGLVCRVGDLKFRFGIAIRVLLYVFVRLSNRSQVA